MDRIIWLGSTSVDSFLYLVWLILPTDKALLFVCGYKIHFNIFNLVRYLSVYLVLVFSQQHFL